MEAGRQLDERVARAVFGPPSRNPGWYQFRATGLPPDEGAAIYVGPHFSTNIAVAWMICERLNRRTTDDERTVAAYRRWVRFDDEMGKFAPPWHSTATDVALNICHAALAAVKSGGRRHD